MKASLPVWVLLRSILFLALAFACDTKQPQVTDEALEKPSIDHVKFTENCEECHEPDRAKLGPNVDGNITTEHGFGRSCIECHSFPIWKNFPNAINFHVPNPPSCLGCHSVTQEKSTHAAQGNCDPCHNYPAWKPAVLGLRPDQELQ